jgi:hypothetical protein
MSLTLISHIFNEEYLLPFWLEYHSKIFDYGIIIDYCSTDSSIEIIKKFCPHWKIVTTKNIINNKPLFEARLVDTEVTEIEKSINGFKIVLNVTEWFLCIRSKEDIIKTLIPNKHYFLNIYQVMSNKINFYPKNIMEFCNNITHFKHCKDRGNRILHNKKGLDYTIGRHSRIGRDNNIYNHDFIIMWTGFYPSNNAVIKRKLQIQQNIPRSDVVLGRGFQHIVDYNTSVQNFTKELNKSEKLYQDKYDYIYKKILNILDKCNNNIYYSELFINSEYGKNQVLLNDDINLLKHTSFDINGYEILKMTSFNDLLQKFLLLKIFNITGKHINLELYHNEITEVEHVKILNSMPYKKEELLEFSNYIIRFMSDELKEELKIFNNDIWYRICRPSVINENDNNTCHRDIYLDFYRNCINIYIPVCGSNENSALQIQPGSHKWNENETSVTKGHTIFKYINKSYSIHTIVASKRPINMIRVNPSLDEVLLFSPYLIHGCASNNNLNITRISLEIRFIQNNLESVNQEEMCVNYLKNRTSR